MTTYKECLRRVRWRLAVIPPEHKTAELCLVAVTEYSAALYHVPDKHMTPELCILAIKQDTQGNTLFRVPLRFRTKEVCLVSVKHQGMSLRFVPMSLV